MNAVTQTQDSPRYFWKLMRAAPLVSLVVFITNTLHMTLPLLFGLIMRAFFDALAAGQQPLPPTQPCGDNLNNCWP
ncbi:MAG: hypothetical protein R3A44_41930 [Caldilineaceae bacterium]